MKNKKIIIRKVLKKEFPLLAEYLSKEALPKYSSSQYLRRFKFWWLENPAFQKNDSYGRRLNKNTKTANKYRGLKNLE